MTGRRDLPAGLRRTIVMAADALADAGDPWWIISGAALALHGVAPIDVADVDVLASVADARRLVGTLGLRPVSEPTSRFRSTLFARWTDPPLTVEIMAGFEVATANGWMSVGPAGRVAVEVDGHIAYIPTRDDMAAMLRCFGRPKDLARLRLLKQLD